MCLPKTYLTAQPFSSVCCSVGIFVTGIVYGLQPDALFVIIPALTLPTKLAAAAYTLMFVFGTCAAMGGYTAVIGELLPHPAESPTLQHRYRLQLGVPVMP